MLKKIGFIGLGIMGGGMSRNILKNGYDLMVYNRSREKTTPLAEAGAKVADSPRQMAEWADTVVLMLTGPEEYPVQFPLKHMAKDIRFALQTADETGAAAPLGQLLFQIYRQGVGQGLADADFAAVQKVIEAMSDREPA